MFSINTIISDAGLFLIAIVFLIEGLLLWKIGNPLKQVDWVRHTVTGKNAFTGIAIVFAFFLGFVVVGFFTLAEASENGATRIEQQFLGPISPEMNAQKEAVYKANRLTFFPYFYVEAALDMPKKGKFSPQCERDGDQVASNLRLVGGLMQSNRFEAFAYIGHQSCAVGEDYHTEDTFGLGARLYLYKK